MSLEREMLTVLPLAVGRQRRAGLVPMGEGLSLDVSVGAEISLPKIHWGNAPKAPGLCRLLWEQLVGTLVCSCQTSPWLNRSTAGGSS